MNKEIKKACNHYVNVISSIQTDTGFLLNYLEGLVDKDLSERSISNSTFELFQGGFAVYDLSHESQEGILAPFFEKHIHITIENLKSHYINFSNWVINASLLRAYNILEILLLRAIQDKYFPNLENPINGSGQMKSIHYAIEDELKSSNIKCDKRNNRHLIQFISIKSDKFLSFKNKMPRTDLNTNWESFFEFISILRNVIVHHDMIITKNVHNDLKSNCKILFERYFTLVKDEDGYDILFYNKEQLRSNLLQLYSDFGINTVKFIYDEDDLSFIGFHKLRWIQ